MPVEKIRTFLGRHLERGVTKGTEGVIYRCTDCGNSWATEQEHKCGVNDGNKENNNAKEVNGRATKD